MSARWISRLSFLALLASSVCGTGCAAEADEDGEEVGDDEEADDDTEAVAMSESELVSSAKLKVVQFNPYYGGRYARYAYSRPGGGHDGPHTYETAAKFGELLAAKHGDAAIIGMQEIDSAGVAEEMRKRLGGAWQVMWIGGPKQTGSAIYWRGDMVSLQKNLGTKVVNHFDKKHGGTAVVFGGALFEKEGRRFGFFTGKMTPRTFDGHNDEEKNEEAGRLRGWIQDVMGPYPKAARIIAIDQNDPYRGLAWNELRRQFTTPLTNASTWKSPRSGTWFRYDYIWWDRDGGAKRKGGFLGKPAVMGDTGSDHRAVISTVAI